MPFTNNSKRIIELEEQTNRQAGCSDEQIRTASQKGSRTFATEKKIFRYFNLQVI